MDARCGKISHGSRPADDIGFCPFATKRFSHEPEPMGAAGRTMRKKASRGTGPTGIKRRTVKAAPPFRTLARCLLAARKTGDAFNTPPESQLLRSHTRKSIAPPTYQDFTGMARISQAPVRPGA